MKTGTPGVTGFILRCSYCLFLMLLVPFVLQAQDEGLSADQERTSLIKSDRLGAFVSLGVNTLQMDAFNERLNSLQVGSFDQDLFAAAFGLSIANHLGDEISLDFHWAGTATYKRDTYLALNTFSLGGTIYKVLFRYKRFDLDLLAGYRMTDMNFEYNDGRTKANSFNSLFDNQFQDSKVINMRTQENHGAVLGGRFLYELGRKESVKPGKFRIGLESGYNFYIKTNPWQEIGSTNFVSDMPELKPENFFLQLTLSFLYKPCKGTVM
ncbi:hypothetical protein [Botryobacter ruber]|uniref:hypothetical protein n=1 Tax=Botryobacter ruber TaxID=2171629 RepID=UPI000F64DFB4|nr:hypothetical protein [Botryobacter ruber]